MALSFMQRRASLLLLLTLALLGFAANQLLTRAALGGKLIDPADFTLVRLVSGAGMLACLTTPRAALAAGSWWSAWALAAYAIAFTLAYARVSAGAGALLLFATVQATMIGWGMVTGERPSWRSTGGLGVALAGLVVLTAPGAAATDATGALLMIAAGVAWGVYSLRGRGASAPMAATTGNFFKAVPLVLVVLLPMRPDALPGGAGLLLAILCGTVASALAYAAWYAAVARLTAWRAAIVQLSVPVLTAVGAVVLLGEPLTPRLVVAGCAVVGGLALSLSPPRLRRPNLPLQGST